MDESKEPLSDGGAEGVENEGMDRPETTEARVPVVPAAAEGAGGITTEEAASESDPLSSDE